jgi:hypothetical protein
MSEPTSAELARAICLRGIMATFSSAVVFTVGNIDDFETPWETLPSAAQERWLTLAGVLERVTGTPGWSGALTCIEPEGGT